jgi:ATP synthase subunit 6
MKFMTLVNLIYSPLEQFYIIPLFEVNFSTFSFFITNETVMLFLLFIFGICLWNAMLKPSTTSFYVIPTRAQLILNFSYKAILYLVLSNVGKKEGQKYFPILFSLFWYIVLLNVLGLIPFSFTLTSHLIVTFSLSSMFFIGINIIAFRKHGLNLFGFFFPQGISFGIALLLTPIELLSYFFRPISLSIRLFANMMAGHTLLKVLAIFAWSIAHAAGITAILYVIPCIILIPLFALEFVIAILQALVFVLLATVYLGDVLNLH